MNIIQFFVVGEPTPVWLKLFRALIIIGIVLAVLVGVFLLHTHSSGLTPLCYDHAVEIPLPLPAELPYSASVVIQLDPPIPEMKALRGGCEVMSNAS